MKKKAILILATVLCLMGMSHSQTTLPNAGFEFWQNVGSDSEEPINWNSNKTGGGFASLGPQTCFREESEVHSGAYCLKLQNSSIFESAVNATASTGKIEVPNLDPSDAYIQTITSVSDFSSTFTGRPDSLVGWFKFSQGGEDIGSVRAILHTNFDLTAPDQGGSEIQTIGQASFDLPNGSTSSWTRFSVPFTYQSEATPSYILLVALASIDITTGNTNTILWLDDLDVIYATVGMVENSFTEELKVYPNPTDGNFSIDLGAEHKLVTVSLTALTGEILLVNTYHESQLLNLEIKEPSGTYLLTVESGNQKAVIRVIKE